MALQWLALIGSPCRTAAEREEKEREEKHHKSELALEGKKVNARTTVRRLLEF